MKILNLWHKVQTIAKLLYSQIAILFYVVSDRRNPIWMRGLILLLLIYTLSPIDLIPDFIPLLGYLDDLVLVPLGLWLVFQMISEERIHEYWEKIKQNPLQPTLEYLRYRKMSLVMTILIWVFILTFFIRFIQSFIVPYWMNVF